VEPAVICRYKAVTPKYAQETVSNTKLVRRVKMIDYKEMVCYCIFHEETIKHTKKNSWYIFMGFNEFTVYEVKFFRSTLLFTIVLAELPVVVRENNRCSRSLVIPFLYIIEMSYVYPLYTEYCCSTLRTYTCTYNSTHLYYLYLSISAIIVYFIIDSD